MISKGVSFDVAFAWDHAWVLAAVVIFGELEDNKFDWDRMQWEKKPDGQ